MTTDPTRQVNRLSREEIAYRAAQDLQDGWYVNLGIGIPTLIADSLATDRGITLHSENGILGMGPAPAEGAQDGDIIDAGKRFASIIPGSSFFDSTASFGMLRGGHVHAAVVGAYQVSEQGDLANWKIGSKRIGGIGGAADIGAAVPELFVTMTHTTPDGNPKIVERCTFPLTAIAAVNRIYTDVAVIDVTATGLRLLEVVEGLTPEQVQSITAAALTWDEVSPIVRRT